MNNLKYIVGESGDIAIFSPTATHQDVARTMMSKPAGAGFITIRTTNEEYGSLDVHCYGASVSLNIQSRNEIDNKAILKVLNT